MREISSCSCLTALPGPARVLLSKTYKPLFAPLYLRLDASSQECPLLSDKLSSLPSPHHFFQTFNPARERVQHFPLFAFFTGPSFLRKFAVVRNSDRIGHEQPLIFLKRSSPLLRWRLGRKFVYGVFEFSDYSLTAQDVFTLQKRGWRSFFPSDGQARPCNAWW